MKTILLATDLDGTLIGDNRATQKLNAMLEILRQTMGLKLVYVTGRSLKLFNELQNEISLLTPDALIAAVGTEIYIEGEKIIDWPQVEDWDIAKIRSILSVYAELKLQPTPEQGFFKLSYLLENNNHLVKMIRKQLSSFHVSVVYSMGLYLDILPAKVNKGSALLYLAEKWSIEQGNTYACGDSGNDIDMLACCNAIIVGNANIELQLWAKGQSGGIYKAKSNYANGIIEGLVHYRITE